MKILASQVFYPVSIGRYIIEALQERPDVELKTVGPAWGNQIPWNGNLYLPQKYTFNPDIPLPKNINNIPMAFVENHLNGWQPDVVLQIDAGFHMIGRPVYGYNVEVLTDPHALMGFYDQVRPYFDLVWNMQTPYMKPDHEYLMYAYSDKWFYPEDTPKVYDACLIGLHYHQRDRLVDALRAKGLNVYYDIGPAFDEYRQIYNQSKVAISWSSLLDTPMRVYEAMGMRIPLVANRTPDLMNQFKDGLDFKGFDTVEQAVEVVLWFLQNPADADRIASNGYLTATFEYTWRERVGEMIDQLMRKI